MGCKEFDITSYYRLTPTTDISTGSSSCTQKTANSRFKPVVSVSISNYRYYSPELGRWLSREPLEEWGSINLYSFVYNIPTTWWDYIGNEPKSSKPTKNPFNPKGYNTKDDAGIAGSIEAGRRTRTDENAKKGKAKPHEVEYCGQICKCEANGKYYLTGPVRGFKTAKGRDVCNVSSVPCKAPWKPVGKYHSHTFDFKKEDYDAASDIDKNSAKEGEVYVHRGQFTPGGDDDFIDRVNTDGTVDEIMNAGKRTKHYNRKK